MEMTVVVAIPALGRPQRVAPLLESLQNSTVETSLLPLFVCSPGDAVQIAAVEEADAELLVVRWEPGAGDFAQKTNYAFAWAVYNNVDWFFAGADDLHFHRGWADEAVSVAEESGAGMIGTNDLGNARVMEGRHATHSLFRRSYVEECGTADRQGQVYCEEYDHQFCDTEAYETAVARDCFAFAANAVVEHLHPFWRKGEMDETYKKGLAHADADRRLFQQRRVLWC